MVHPLAQPVRLIVEVRQSQLLDQDASLFLPFLSLGSTPASCYLLKLITEPAMVVPTALSLLLFLLLVVLSLFRGDPIELDVDIATNVLEQVFPWNFLPCKLASVKEHG